MLSSRRSIAVSLCAALALVLSACGSETTAEEKAATIPTESSAETAAPSTTDAGEADDTDDEPAEPAPTDDRVGSPAGAGAVELIAASADRVAAQESARIAVVIAADDVTVEMEGELGFAADGSSDAAFRLDLSAVAPELGSGVVEMRFVDDAMYMSADAFAAQMGAEGALPDGVKWLSFDLGKVADQFGGEMSGGSSSASSFTNLFALLRGVSDRVTEVGSDEIRGVETTHYRAEVDVERAIATLPDDQRADTSESLEQLVDGTVPVDVWIDSDGLPRRMLLETDAAKLGDALGPSAKGTASVTFDLYDYGVEVDVEAPPADETIDLFEMLMGGLAGLGDSAAA